MELAELQNLWDQFDNRIAENTRINRGILKKIILSKTENRITWIRLKAIFNLIIPIPMLIYIVYDTDYRAEPEFLIGLILSSICFIITYGWAIKYYVLVSKIDFLNPVITIKKNLNKFKQFRLRIKRIRTIIAPSFFIGIFLFAGIPFFAKEMIPVYLLILLVAAISAYLNYKYGIFEQLKRINLEIEEMAQLEKE